MRIAILGLGYVGVTTAACLLREGHHVVGVDISSDKMTAIGSGRSPVVEPGVNDLLKVGHAEGRLSVASRISDEIGKLDLVIICVGTPSRSDGKLDLSHLLEVTRQIGTCLEMRSPDQDPLLLVYRSTMPPGTMDRLVVPTLIKITNELPGNRYEVAFNPEFLRESTAIKDYFSPPKIIIGERAEGVTKKLKGMYHDLDAPLFEVPFKIAEMVKFVDNSFHALKVAFANEIGRIAVEMSIDPQRVAEIFVADTKLNISPYYLRPGGPYGGSCLPKDLSAMLALARDNGLTVPVLRGVGESNGMHLAWLANAIRNRVPAPGPILLLGLAFKSGTDDLRASPLLDLAEMLLDDDYDLSIYDPDLDPDRLVGVNFAVAVEHQETLLNRLTDNVNEAASRASLIILGKPIPGIKELLPADRPVLDITQLDGF